VINQIKQIENWDRLTADEIVTALSSPVLREDSIYSFNQLVIAFDNVELAETLVGAMRAAGLNASADSLVARGLDFGLQGVQDNIDKLGQAIPDIFTPEWVGRLKALGTQSLWASLGGRGEVPSVEQVQSALDVEADSQARQHVAELLYGEAWNQHVAPVLDGDRDAATKEKLVAGLRGLVDALEAE
jgi:hypothetical protein